MEVREHKKGKNVKTRFFFSKIKFEFFGILVGLLHELASSVIIITSRCKRFFFLLAPARRKSRIAGREEVIG